MCLGLAPPYLAALGIRHTTNQLGLVAGPPPDQGWPCCLCHGSAERTVAKRKSRTIAGGDPIEDTLEPTDTCPTTAVGTPATMASPWPNRAASLNSPIESAPKRSIFRNSNAARAAVFMPEAQLVEETPPGSQYSSSSDSDATPNHPQRPQHGRSLSHPFPSLFTGRRKKQKSQAPGDVSDLSTDECGNASGQPRTPQHSTRSRNCGKRDFVTGNCMVCGSLVRWPQGLTVFKCTVCLTINDLLPDQEVVRGRGDGGSQKPLPKIPIPGRSPVHRRMSPIPTCQFRYSNRWPTAGPISIGETRAIIKYCIRLAVDQALPARPIRRGDVDPSVAEGGQPIEPYTTPSRREGPGHRSRSVSYAGGSSNDNVSSSVALPSRTIVRNPEEEARRVFKPLEDHLIACLSSTSRLDMSFAPRRRSVVPRDGAADRHRDAGPRRGAPAVVPDLDAKLLLLGDVAENGLWWTGGQDDLCPTKNRRTEGAEAHGTTASRMRQVDWAGLDSWYAAVTNAGEGWAEVYREMSSTDVSGQLSTAQLADLEAQILQSQENTRRVLLKATENLLKRPGRPISSPADLRFLLLLLANPLLNASSAGADPPKRRVPARQEAGRGSNGPASGRHSGIIKRALGLLASSPPECHSHIVAYFSRLPGPRFLQLKDLVSGFLASRLLRCRERSLGNMVMDTSPGLVSKVSVENSPATLRAASRTVPMPSGKVDGRRKMTYSDDWQVRAAVHTTSLLFAANSSRQVRRHSRHAFATPQDGARDGAYERSRMLPSSDFYVALLDDMDMVADFEAWEGKRAKFSFCQYPCVLSIFAKIQILEHDARRQMRSKARDAFFESIMTRRNVGSSPPLLAEHGFVGSRVMMLRCQTPNLGSGEF